MSPVTPTAPITPPPVVAAENHVSREERQQQLPVDKIVRATVAEGGQDRVMLEINQQRFQVETRLPLKTGQKLSLMVVATNPRIELQLIEDPLQQRLANAMHILGEKWNLLSLSQFLETEGLPLIDALSPRSRVTLLSWATMRDNDIMSLDGTGLRQLIINLGLDLEAKLASGVATEMGGLLKSALLEALHLDKTGTGLTETAEHILHLLELFQFCQLKLTRQDVFFVPLPLPFLDQGFIIIDRQKQHQVDAKPAPPFRLSLHLSLQNLGDLRIDLLHDPGGLYIRFVCDSQEKADFVAAYKEELVHGLSSFPLHDITFAADAESPANALLAKMIPQGDSILDTRV
jgi:hypothetical protein